MIESLQGFSRHIFYMDRVRSMERISWIAKKILGSRHKKFFARFARKISLALLIKTWRGAPVRKSGGVNLPVPPTPTLKRFLIGFWSLFFWIKTTQILLKFKWDRVHLQDQRFS